jgi:pimeloyl-ACP methyl ester carboxylesterase
MHWEHLRLPLLEASLLLRVNTTSSVGCDRRGKCTKTIKGSRLVTLSCSGHFGHPEEPDIFTQAVRDFIAS